MATSEAPKPPPDLDTQFEDLLHQVFDSERRERMLDRIDIAVALEERKKARRRKKPKP